MPHFPLLISSLRRREEATSPEDERYGSGDKTQIEKKNLSNVSRRRNVREVAFLHIVDNRTTDSYAQEVDVQSVFPRSNHRE